MAAAQNGLTISGRGGVPPAIESPLDSHNIYVSGQTDTASAMPEPVVTSIGKIQPARGIKLAEDGTVVLTAYRTNNAGERLPETKLNCG